MAEWTREMPWRQGQLLSDEAVQALNLNYPHDPAATIVIVATHDCDLAQLPETEPMIEVVVGHRIEKADGNYTHAKNARTLNIGFEGEPLLLAEFTITAKCSVEKIKLIDFQPKADHSLSVAGKATVQRWLAARYRRSAFPDEFERRLVRETKLAERIAKAVKPHGEMITLVLFDVDEGQENLRTGSEDVYLLDIILLHAVAPDFDKAEEAANTAKKEIQTAFEKKLLDPESGKWQSIELRYLDVISEEALSYRQFTLVKPWRLEYISLGTDPQQPIAPE
jgi:hypothetical protein